MGTLRRKIDLLELHQTKTIDQDRKIIFIVGETGVGKSHGIREYINKKEQLGGNSINT